ncbi:TetR family transcriptional regulator [Pricia sp. S334]|uniref:Biofilm operon icaADBC HTH-type negative transcriptional regulator IcaR n=1 Tax=Pricia mediterranea TaxID=3076079 RepID=A0ABU3L533_9FLAO|nr:TetR family transcriptional regulator [Pricia sp. S334]MDT7828835.1 TetR family transcriptional regulator [Pricia sp. S334]
MGRKSLKEVRQKETVEAFYQVAKKEGLENASLAKVAKEMGVNTSLVLHYFGSKNELIYGLIDFIMKRYKSLYSIKDDVNTGDSHLEQVLNNLFSREWNEVVEDGVFYGCFTLAFKDEKIKAAFKELHENLRSLLVQAIEDAKKNGEVDVEDSAEAADLIYILVEGAYYYLSLYEQNEAYYKKQEKYKQAAWNILKMNKQ